MAGLRRSKQIKNRIDVLIAHQRQVAIREFSDLGAGFQVAALNLELSGAGNLLGGQQSGHIDAIGFDLYTQMLERTVRELRGEEIEEETSTQLNSVRRRRSSRIT